MNINFMKGSEAKRGKPSNEDLPLIKHSFKRGMTHSHLKPEMILFKITLILEEKNGVLQLEPRPQSDPQLGISRPVDLN